MLSLRNRFGIPGVISVLALVFALVAGGAYAAENSGDDASASAKKNNRAKNNRKAGGLNGKQKRQVIQLSRREAKRFQGTGPVGPQGFPGVPGAPGEDGDDGDDGSNGSNGKNGESVTLGAATGCSEGGTKLSVGGDSEEVCNGEEGEQGPEGSPWTDLGTLPAGETLTGVWGETGGIDTNEEAKVSGQTLFIPISFPLPLGSAPEGIFVDEEEESASGCPGIVEGVPAADAGKLCIYETASNQAGNFVGIFFDPVTGAPGVSKVGAVVPFSACTGISCRVYGTWAVTAP